MNTSRVGDQFILSKEFMNYYSDTYWNTDSYSDTDSEKSHIILIKQSFSLIRLFEKASYLWQQLELASETLWTGAGSGLLFSMLEKIN